MNSVKVSIEYMARQEYAASQMMKEMVQNALEQAERDGYDVEWVVPDEMVLTARGDSCETHN